MGSWWVCLRETGGGRTADALDYAGEHVVEAILRSAYLIILTL